MDDISNRRPIAILLAVYNGEKYLAEQIDSLLAQTCQAWTLYIRNDDSTDGTQSIIDKYCNEYPGKIEQIDKGGRNLGCNSNFFRLLDVVRSDYYMFCDADDVWLPEKVEISYDTLVQNENKNIPLLVHTDKIVCDSKLNIVLNSWWRSNGLNPDLFLKYRYVPLAPVVGGATCMFNNAAKKHCFPLPPFPPAHDAWIPMQTAKFGKIISIHKPLILYRQHQNNTIGASCTPYKLHILKVLKIKTILRRDLAYLKYLQTLGYGSAMKYYLCRVVVILKLLYSKKTYK